MIVNTFISDTEIVPIYTEISLRQARKLNPSLPIHFICKNKPLYFDDLNIIWINQDSIKGDLITLFNNLSWFNRHGTPRTTHPSPKGFWHRTCERIFYLAEYAQQQKLDRFIHTENDVLLYGNYQEYLLDIENNFYATIMSEKQATFAIVNIPNYNYIVDLCRFFLELMKNGEQKLSMYFGDHVSEMTLLRYAMNKGLIDTFDIVPLKSKFVFDPGSYGQFLGGTNNFHKSGFIDDKHYIGQAIKNGKLKVEFNSIPTVNNKPLFNLHVHSKQLEKFI